MTLQPAPKGPAEPPSHCFGESRRSASRGIGAGRHVFRLCVVASVLLAAAYYAVAPRLFAQRSTPLIIVETTQGTFGFETYPKEAPASVTHVIELVKAGFYDGQRVHRAVSGFLVQFGDPQTRDLERQWLWGRGDAASSGKPIGVAEVSAKRKNVALSVGLAHMGEPAKADSQLYILLDDRPELDGQYAVIGQVVEGEDVPAKLQVGDQIRRVFVRE
jgi:peptidyl-prolyl cis-trans isomerase B (cyclophilin B)